MKVRILLPEPFSTLRRAAVKISSKDVEHVAELARLRFNEDELIPCTQQLNSILDYFETLQKVDTRDVPASTHAVTVSNAFREDTLAPSLPSGEALHNAPDAERSCFKVPKIIEV
ncbi:MAG: Asp-tRNA(Asn)/Glu-tRNA(Gln) amidotransferase subunit GatC [Pseudomonadota bacterium]